MIDDTIKNEIIRAAQNNFVKRLVLFGSRARKSNMPRSDIDLAVFGGNFEKFATCVNEEVNTLLTFDIVDMNMASDELLKQVERDGVTIYEKV